MGKIPLQELLHIGIVVADAQAAAHRFARIYGVAQWQVSDLTADRLRDTQTRGHRAEHAFRLARGVAPTEHGPIELRLIEPRGGWTAYKEFLLTKGEGIHHVGTARVSPAELVALAGWLKSEGVGIAQADTYADGTRETSFDTRATLGGFCIQICDGDNAPARGGDATWDLGAEVPADGPLLPLGTFAFHFGVVVHDLMARVGDWTRLCGLTEWNFMNWRSAPGSLENPEYLGKPVDHAYFTTLVNVTPRLGFEIIQPTFGPSHYKENYRNLVGEGIHHVNATMLPDAAAWQASAKRLEQIGVPVVMGGGIGGGFANFYYADTARELGYVTEIIHPGPQWDKGPAGIQPVMHVDLSH